MYFHGYDEAGEPVWKNYPKRLEPKYGEATAIRTDEMDPIRTNADDSGEIFTSKSAYERHLKEKGFTIKEAGMLSKSPLSPAEKISKEAIREMAEKSFYDIKYDRVPFTEREKEICRREERAFKEAKRRF